MIDKRHADLNKSLDDDPEEPIYIQPADTNAEKPYYLQPPQLPAQTIQQLEELRNQIDDTLYNHPISRGIAGSNAPDSGYGLSILAENDATPTGRLLKECARVFAGTGTNILELYQAKVKAKRTTVVSERRGMAHPVKWSGKSLAGQTRVVVPPDSVLPVNHAGMMELGKQMMQMREDWFPTPGSFLSFIKAPGVDSMVEVLDDDTSRAEYENYRMAEGEPMEVMDFDDHAKHIQQHNHFRKSPRYLALPINVRHLFDLHVQDHKAMQASAVGMSAGLGMMAPPLGADPLLGAGISPQQLPPLALPPSGAEVQTPEIPQGEM